MALYVPCVQIFPQAAHLGLRGSTSKVSTDDDVSEAGLTTVRAVTGTEEVGWIDPEEATERAAGAFGGVA